MAGPFELTRSPFELGWDREVSLDTHNFLGREALIAEKKNGGPDRQLVGLIWNKDDVIDVFASLFRDDENISADGYAANDRAARHRPWQGAKKKERSSAALLRAYIARTSER